MKKLILTILITTALFAFEIRDSESGIKPDRFRKLQGGVLIAYNIEKVEFDTTQPIYRYGEILLLKPDSIQLIPDNVEVTESEIDSLESMLK